jgi:hypothetical protein
LLASFVLLRNEASRLGITYHIGETLHYAQDGKTFDIQLYYLNNGLPLSCFSKEMNKAFIKVLKSHKYMQIISILAD